MAYAGGKMLAEVDSGIGLITFNNPERRNAMSVEMWQGLVEILDRFEADGGVYDSTDGGGLVDWLQEHSELFHCVG